MKRRRLIILVLGCVLVATLVSLIWPHEPEPQYGGLSLSTWVIRCNNSLDTEALDTVRQLGTNSLPFLIRWIQYERPSWKNWIFGASTKLPPLILHSRVMRWFMTDNAWLRAKGALVAFSLLKSDADPAIPELQRIANEAKSESSSRRRARFCIVLIKARIDPGELPIY